MEKRARKKKSKKRRLSKGDKFVSVESATRA
jgi:hypothetical protein